MNTPPKPTIVIEDPRESWMKVEEFLWTHGRLPLQEDVELKFTTVSALRGMAQAIQKRDPKHFPTPSQVIYMLLHVADKLERHQQGKANKKAVKRRWK